MKNSDQEIIAIGDVHGRRCWEEIVERHPGAHFVFLGDYCDPYERRSRSGLVRNLKNILTLKRERPDDVTLLLGNHDLHYFVEGFPKGSRYDEVLAPQLHDLFAEERELFAYAYEEGPLLFTHAGMSRGWCEKCWRRALLPSPAQCFNHPEELEDQGAALYTCGPYRWGPDAAGGIFWADEEELEDLPAGWIQIVGHNWLDSIRHIQDGEKADLLICDCLAERKYLKIVVNDDGRMSFFEMGLDGGELLIFEKMAAAGSHCVDRLR